MSLITSFSNQPEEIPSESSIHSIRCRNPRQTAAHKSNILCLSGRGRGGSGRTVALSVVGATATATALTTTSRATTVAATVSTTVSTATATTTTTASTLARVLAFSGSLLLLLGLNGAGVLHNDVRGLINRLGRFGGSGGLGSSGRLRSRGFNGSLSSRCGLRGSFGCSLGSLSSGGLSGSLSDRGGLSRLGVEEVRGLNGGNQLEELAVLESAKLLLALAEELVQMLGDVLKGLGKRCSGIVSRAEGSLEAGKGDKLLVRKSQGTSVADCLTKNVKQLGGLKGPLLHGSLLVVVEALAVLLGTLHKLRLHGSQLLLGSVKLGDESKDNVLFGEGLLLILLDLLASLDELLDVANLSQTLVKVVNALSDEG
eukprot:Colp12_sorted_trinity150504_noHs@25750